MIRTNPLMILHVIVTKCLLLRIISSKSDDKLFFGKRFDFIIIGVIVQICILAYQLYGAIIMMMFYSSLSNDRYYSLKTTYYRSACFQTNRCVCNNCSERVYVFKNRHIHVPLTRMKRSRNNLTLCLSLRLIATFFSICGLIVPQIATTTNKLKMINSNKMDHSRSLWNYFCDENYFPTQN